MRPDQVPCGCGRIPIPGRTEKRECGGQISGPRRAILPAHGYEKNTRVKLFFSIVNASVTIMTKGAGGGDGRPGRGPDTADPKPSNAAALRPGEGLGEGHHERPSEAQRRYLARGLREPGGKLPLFDEDGRMVPRKTVDSCIAYGWAQPWIANPIKPDWLVCRLTPLGYAVLTAEDSGPAPEEGR